MPTPRRLGFAKENRVLRRADFLKAYERGRPFRRKGITIFLAQREQQDLPTRIGITVTRKVGKAVVRNRLKRLAREAFRLALPDLKPGHTMIVNFHPSGARMSFRQVNAQLRSVWKEAGVMADV